MCRKKWRTSASLARTALSDSQAFNVGILLKLERRPTLREVKDTSRSAAYLDSFRIAMYIPTYLVGFGFFKRLARWLAFDYRCIGSGRNSNLLHNIAIHDCFDLHNKIIKFFIRIFSYILLLIASTVTVKKCLK